MSSVSCASIREHLSAELDGELDSQTDRRASVDASTHLSRCAGCTAWLATATTMHRSLRVGAAQPVPDRSVTILAAIDREEQRRLRTSRPSVIPMSRVALLIVGIVAMAASLPELLHADDAFASAHGARELAIFELTLAAGFVIAARRPVHAGLVAVLGLMVSVGLVVTGAFDLGLGHTALGMEVHHTLAVVGTVLACLIARAEPIDRRVTAFRPSPLSW